MDATFFLQEYSRYGIEGSPLAGDGVSVYWFPHHTPYGLRRYAHSDFGIYMSDRCVFYFRDTSLGHSQTKGFVIVDDLCGWNFDEGSLCSENTGILRWDNLCCVKYIASTKEMIFVTRGNAENVSININLLTNDLTDADAMKYGPVLAEMFTNFANTYDPYISFENYEINQALHDGNVEAAVLQMVEKRGNTGITYYTQKIAEWYSEKGEERNALKLLEEDIKNLENRTKRDSHNDYRYTKGQDLYFQKYLIHKKLGEPEEARKACIYVINNTKEYAQPLFTDLDMPETARKDLEDLEKEFSEHFLDIPPKDRKWLVPVKSYKGVDLYKTPFQVIIMNHLPEIEFPDGHPIANKLYVEHPHVPHKYIPFNDPDFFWGKEKTLEYCKIMQLLGATEIDIKTAPSSDDDPTKSGLNKDTQLLESIGQSIPLHQRYDPYCIQKLPTDMIWLYNEPSWMRTYIQRMQGSLLESEERIEINVAEVMSDSELKSISTAYSALIAGAKDQWERPIEEKIEFKENVALSIKVKFAPLENLQDHKAPHQKGLKTDNSPQVKEFLEGLRTRIEESPQTESDKDACQEDQQGYLSKASEFVKLRETVHALLTRYRNVREICEMTDNNWHSKTIESLGKSLTDDCFTVAIVGDANSGKSAFINALLNCKGLLPAHHNRTTCGIIRIEWGNEPKAEITFSDGKTERISGEGFADKIRPYLTTCEGGDTPANISIKYPFPEALKGWRIIDTPEIEASGYVGNDIIELLAKQKEVGENLVDSIIVVQNGHQTPDESDCRNFVKDLLENNISNNGLFLVLTQNQSCEPKIDEKSVLDAVRKGYGSAIKAVTYADGLLRTFLNEQIGKDIDLKNYGYIEKFPSWQDNEWKEIMEILDSARRSLREDGEAYNKETLLKKLVEWADFDRLVKNLNEFALSRKSVSLKKFVRLVKCDYENFRQRFEKDEELICYGDWRRINEEIDLIAKRTDTYSQALSEVEDEIRIDGFRRNFDFVDSALEGLDKMNDEEEIKTYVANLFDKIQIEENRLFKNISERVFSHLTRDEITDDQVINSIDFEEIERESVAMATPSTITESSFVFQPSRETVNNDTKCETYQDLILEREKVLFRQIEEILNNMKNILKEELSRKLDVQKSHLEDLKDELEDKDKFKKNNDNKLEIIRLSLYELKAKCRCYER